MHREHAKPRIAALRELADQVERLQPVPSRNGTTAPISRIERVLHVLRSNQLARAELVVPAVKPEEQRVDQDAFTGPSGAM
jgi:hypothetical protein